MRVLLRPRWLVGTIIAVLLVVLFVSLGFWQLRRLDEKRERNAAIEDRSSRPVQPVDEVVDPEARFDEVGDLVYRRGAGPGPHGGGRGGRPGHRPPGPGGRGGGRGAPAGPRRAAAEGRPRPLPGGPPARAPGPAG